MTIVQQATFLHRTGVVVADGACRPHPTARPSDVADDAGFRGIESAAP